MNHWMTSPYEWLLTMSIDHSSYNHSCHSCTKPPNFTRGPRSTAKLPCYHAPAMHVQLARRKYGMLPALERLLPGDFRSIYRYLLIVHYLYGLIMVG